jgi:hypothetical protein
MPDLPGPPRIALRSPCSAQALGTIHGHPRDACVSPVSKSGSLRPRLRLREAHGNKRI